MVGLADKLAWREAFPHLADSANHDNWSAPVESCGLEVARCRAGGAAVAVTIQHDQVRLVKMRQFHGLFRPSRFDDPSTLSSK